MHQLLPPTYREVWLEWRDSEQQKEEESRTAANKPRDQFISRLLTRLKQQNQNQGAEPQVLPPRGGAGRSRSGHDDEEPEESWEDLATLDIREEGEEPEGKAGKRGGRKEGAELFEASRELFKELRKSPLAQKLQVSAVGEQIPEMVRCHQRCL